jgi:hypothetical protein
MYQPEGTRLRFFGRVTVMPSSVVLRSRAMDFWSTSVTCVEALGRIRRAVLMDEACFEANVAEPPRLTVFGPPESVGCESP